MGVNHFSVMSLGRSNLIEPSKVGYRDAVDILRDEFHRTRKAFVKIGFYLKHIRDNQLYQEDGYKTIDEFAAEIFNLSQASTSRYIQICERFSQGGNSPELDQQFAEYNVSQLIEMVTIDREKIEQLSPTMSVREIKEFKKPSGRCIKIFYEQYILDTEFASNREGLEDYLIKTFGKYKAGGNDSELSFTCSLKGIALNNASEITWSTLVKEINRLIPVKTDSGKKEEQLPEQTNLEKDFPEYVPEEFYATSHKEKDHLEDVPLDKKEQIIDGEFREISEEYINEQEYLVENVDPVALPEKTESSLPPLKNVEQRREWIKNYKAWGLWYRDENIDVYYYKFDFSDGSRLICCEYPARDHEWNEEERDEVHYHLLEKNKSKYGGKKTFDEKFSSRTTSETYLLEFLKRFK